MSWTKPADSPAPINSALRFHLRDHQVRNRPRPVGAKAVATTRFGRSVVTTVSWFVMFAGWASSYACALLTVSVFGIGLPTAAQAQSCSPTSATVNATYTGTALSNSTTTTLSCTGYTSGTTYYLCNFGTSQSGSGGTTISPYRQLDDGNGNKANWQYYLSDGTTPIDGAKGYVIASATGSQLNSGSKTFTIVYGFPQQASGYGTFSTTLVARINFKLRNDCADAITTGFDHTMKYTVAVPASCSSLAAGTLAFGNIGSTASAPTSATGTINVTCTARSPFTVYMGSGQNALNGTNRMVSGSNYLKYVLYADSSFSTAWTNTNGVAGTGTGTSQNLTVYGRIPTQPTPPLGSYTDTVIVTLRY